MTFLTVLLTLFVERFVHRQRPQRDGLTQDGIYGPQTHQCLIDLGGDGAAVTGARRPLATRPV